MEGKWSLLIKYVTKKENTLLKLLLRSEKLIKLFIIDYLTIFDFFFSPPNKQFDSLTPCRSQEGDSCIGADFHNMKNAIHQLEVCIIDC